MRRLSCPILLVLAFIPTLLHASVTDHFNAIKSRPRALYTFFKKMPKGGELHYHFDGSSPAETMLSLAARDKYCLNPVTYIFTRYKRICHGITSRHLLKNPERYEETIRAWSMKDFTPKHQSRLEHFFATFGKEASIQSAFSRPLLANIMKHAARQHELYLEVIAFHLDNAAKYASLIQSAKTMEDKKRILLANPDFQNSISKTLRDSNDLLQQARHKLGCDKKPQKPSCSLTVKFQYFVLRETPLDQVFAQALAGFATAARSQDIVGINLVQAENGPISLRDYKAQMQIFNFLHKAWPHVHIALHAGELTPDIVASRQLQFHIHDAVFTGHAERIGHGVDILHENNHEALLDYMAHKPVAVEVNLVSNQKLLGIQGSQHPLRTYLAHHVPVVLSTDDEGILRTNLTKQYVDAVIHHQLDYPAIKAINRNTLTYAFLPGNSIWANAEKQIPVPECQKLSSKSCLQFIKNNMKGTLQWRLEVELKAFEQLF